MALKHHTIIFVPHARAKLRKWRVTNAQLLSLGGALLLLTLGAGLSTWAYFTTTIDRDEIEILRSQNDGLRQDAAMMESSVSELRRKLSDYEERTQKLSILAGLETVRGESGIGGGSAQGLGPNGSPLESADLEGRFESLDGTLDEVEERLHEQARWLASLPTIAPVKGLSTSGYGTRKDPITGKPAFHPGLDISAAPSAPVYASADGIVTLARRNGGLGNAVYIAHGFGINTRYGHLSRIAAKEGDHVKRGDVVGYVGSTGRSTGYHLHYEVRVDGKPTNPIGYILNLTRR
jgi:murein DD-endopeptidase MepM/ murein hydrolase activator NlpD